MRRFVQSFPFLLVMGVCSHAACGDSELGTSSAAVGPVGSQGAGYHPACNLDRRDGYCNFIGQNPETCECFDCVDSAACTNKCSNDGACDFGDDAEDCSCADCNPGPNCGGNADQSSGMQQQSSQQASSTADSSSSDASSSSMSSSAMSSSSGGQGGQGGM